MRFLRPIFSLLISIAIIAPTARAELDVYLQTSREEAAVMTMATPPVMNQTGDPKLDSLAKEMSAAIMYDLTFADYFRVIQEWSFLDEINKLDISSGKIMFDEWRTLKADVLVKSFLRKEGDKLSLNVNVWDVHRGDQITSFIIAGPKEIARRIAHRASDKIVTQFTGERGIAETKIAFVSLYGNRKELYLMDYDGANITRLTADRSIVLFPSFSPDNAMILFTTFKFKNPDLYRLTLATGARKPVATVIGTNTAGVFSPDGSKIAFAISRKGITNIYLMNSDGTGIQQITFGKRIATSPTFSPDGTRLAFVSDETGSPQIYVMTLADGKYRRLTYTGGYNSEPDWSPDGKHIAYSSLAGGTYDIWSVDVDTGQALQLTTSSATDESPSYSPDGRHIAFTSTRSGRRQIHVISANGSNPRQVTFGPGGGYTPAWSNFYGK